MPHDTPVENRIPATDTSSVKPRPRTPQITTSPTIDEADTSRYLGLSVPWLRVRRRDGKGPAFVRTGRTIRYRVQDLDAWLERHVVRTGEQAEAAGR